MPALLPSDRRALRALLLLLGFYATGGLVWAGLLLALVIDVASGKAHALFDLGCLAALAALTWAIVPRPGRFEAHGIPLAPTDQASLRAVVQDVARSAGQRLPSRTYLTLECNASVTWRGVLGREVLTLGLPILQCLTVDQLRAAIAHEFGHLERGNSRLRLWTFRAHNALARAAAGFSWSGRSRRPFELLAIRFLRTSQEVARDHELAADRFAARIVGARVLARCLQVLDVIGPAFQVYWTREFLPLLRSGFRPPLLEGFQRFLVATGSLATAAPESTRAGDTACRFASHPSLTARLDALRGLPEDASTGDAPPARALIDDVPEIEARLVARCIEPLAARQLRAIAWEDVGELVWLPTYRRAVAGVRSGLLRGVHPPELAGNARDLLELGRKIDETEGVSRAPGARALLARQFLAAALALALHVRGYTLRAFPGESPYFDCNGCRVAPDAIVALLAVGALAPDDWQHQCRELGIEHLELDQIVDSA